MGAYDDMMNKTAGEDRPQAPRTLAEANRMLKKGNKNLTDEDLFGYLGHLGNDEVAEEGHNMGAKPKGTLASSSVIKRGYRVIPGTAANQIGVARGYAPDNLRPSRADRERQEIADKEFAALMKKAKVQRPKPMDVRIVADARSKKR